MGKVLAGPWVEPRQEQAPSPLLFEDVSQDLRCFSLEARQSLQHVSIPFKMNTDIHPVHCKAALNLLESLRERLDTLCQSLSQNTSLAVMLSPSRYPTLIDLHLTQKNTSRLMDQLDGYRISCLKPSRRLHHQRREIITLFDKIQRQVENIPGLVMSLEKDIEAQDQKLKTMVKQKTPRLLSTSPKE